MGLQTLIILETSINEFCWMWYEYRREIKTLLSLLARNCRRCNNTMRDSNEYHIRVSADHSDTQSLSEHAHKFNISFLCSTSLYIYKHFKNSTI